jgi:hypothetical protein
MGSLINGTFFPPFLGMSGRGKTSKRQAQDSTGSAGKRSKNLTQPVNEKALDQPILAEPSNLAEIMEEDRWEALPHYTPYPDQMDLLARSSVVFRSQNGVFVSEAVSSRLSTFIYFNCVPTFRLSLSDEMFSNARREIKILLTICHF